MHCLLCHSAEVKPFYSKKDKHLGLREYMECLECELVFLKPQYFLGKDDEKARYDLHENNPDDDNYVTFLKRLTTPLIPKLHKGDRGLDFGCGPGPTIAEILRKEGMEVENYDPIYLKDDSALNRHYQFITASEVVEHFYNPRSEFDKLNTLLEGDRSFLAIMTQMRQRDQDFSQWWYHREPTHVCFYNQKTFEWIGHWQKWTVEFPSPNVVIYSK